MDVHLHSIWSTLLVIFITGLLCSSITTSALDPGQKSPKEGEPVTPTPPESDDQELKNLVNEDKGQTIPENERPKGPEGEEKTENDQLSKSTIPVTTLVSSTPKPAVEHGDFIVKVDDKVCVRVTLKATFTVKYASLRSGKKEFHNAVINLPQTVSVSGACDSNHSSILISWSNNSFALKIEFGTVKGGRSKRDVDTKLPGWRATSVSFTFNTNDDTHFQSPTNAGKHVVKTKPGERYFTAERNQSYACKSKDDVILQEYFKNNNTVSAADIEQVHVQIWNAHVQAFDISPSGKFSQTLVCEQDVISNLPRRKVVPIIVAACLAGLIIIIIVAYFISKNIGHSAYRPMA